MCSFLPSAAFVYRYTSIIEHCFNAQNDKTMICALAMCLDQQYVTKMSSIARYDDV